jgi:hypothetical protein
MTDNTTDIHEVQTASLRQHGAGKNSFVVSITKAIRAAGLEDGGSFQFVPESVDEHGMLLAEGNEVTIDGRGDSLARNIRHQGAGGGTLQLVIPQEGLDALGIDPDAIDWDNPPELTVWAGPQLLAFERAEQQSISVDQAPNG